MEAITVLLSKKKTTTYEHDFCNIFHKHAENCLSFLRDTPHLNSPVLFSLVSGNNERKEARKMRISHSHTLPFSLWYTQTHIKASQAQGWFICSLQWVVGECCAASLLSSSVCNVRVMVCVWLTVCMCVRKQSEGEIAECRCVYSMCVCEWDPQRNTSRHVWYVCVHCSGCGGLDSTD